MENIRKNRKLLKSVLCVIIAAVMSFGYLSFPLRATARAEESEDTYLGQFETTAVTISNGQFESATGTSPKSPTSWTGSYFDTDRGQIISGVIDLSATSYTANSDAYKLDEYPEYADNRIPQTPFGISNNPNGNFPYYEGTNTNVLMLNTNGIETTYKYSSSTISLAANKFYKISAWAKTSDYLDFQDSGAAIKLNGIADHDIGFRNINTVRNLAKDADNLPILNIDNNFGWQQFIIYVSTDYNSYSANLSLQIGDSGEDYYYPTNGYVFFDNITAFEISPELFATETQYNNSNIFVADLNEHEYLTHNDEDGNPILDQNNDATEIGSFNNTTSNSYPLGWTSIDEVGAGGATVKVINPKFSFSHVGLENNPSAPNGIETSEGNNILVISSPDRARATGMKSSNILIERNRYYRIAAWVKTEEVSNGARVVIKGENTIFDGEVDVKSDAIYGDPDNLSRYGWQQQSFYIKGSSVTSCLIHVELWLGQIGAESRGIAMFDDITIEVITEDKYNSNVSNGKEVTFDSISDNTGITNGKFYNAGSYEEYEYPLAPSSWTLYNAANSGTVGYSETAVDVENIKSGIIPVDTEHFNSNKHNYLGARNPLPNEVFPRNVLFLGSSNKTAFGYRSSDITVESSSVTRIYTELMTESIDGYGANLILKNGNKILSTIENINTNGEFRTYNFYVEGHSLNSNTVTLEIWLGMGDKQNNQSKRASGYLFVKEAGMTKLTGDTTFDSYVNDYRFANDANVATFNTNLFLNYNRYSTSFLKESYDWTLDTSRNAKADMSRTDFGIINISDINTSGQSLIPSDFKTDASGNNEIFFMQNRVANAATAIFPTYYNLEESKHYEISVSLKVDIPEEFLAENAEAVGASIALKGTAFEFTDIKDSRTITKVYDEATDSMVDRLADNEFKTYTFFVRCGQGSPASVSFEISLGGYGSSAEFTTGRVYLANVTVEEIEADVYTDKVADLEDDDPYFINADLTAEVEDDTDVDVPTEDDGDSWWENNWYVFPSAIFGIALLFTLVAIFIRRLVEKRTRRTKKIKAKTYDRTSSFDEEEDIDVVDESAVATYDEFDDDAPIDTIRSELRVKRQAKVAVDTTTESKSEANEVEVTEEEVDTSLSEFDE